MRTLALTVMMMSCVAGAETVKMLDREVVVREPNYDEKKIAPYELEDPLTFLDGRKVTKETWSQRRREILGVFSKEMYGAEPPPPEALVTEAVDEKVAVAGFAVRRQYRMWFRADKTGPCVNWILWLPRHAKKPVPVILFLNYGGNHELVLDEDVPVTTAWSRAKDEDVLEHRISAKTRGSMQDPENTTVFPVGEIVARGYAVMSACYCEISSDPDQCAPDSATFKQEVFAYNGVFSLWGARNQRRTDNPTALGAWAWALSRGLDLAERIAEVDAEKAVVTGCSRLGKAALLAAARDERFAVCVPNETGGGGAPLAKRDFGENISTENRSFTHWYCPAYAKYASDPAKLLTFDQHLLLACIAPRALLVEGFGMPWFDTKGEYLALRAASPVWRMLGGCGLPNVAWPDVFDTSAIGLDVGYVRRAEDHGIASCDWRWLLDFADRALGPERETRKWQAAIDAAANSGGGRVTVPAGEHEVGQLELKSNVELRLEKGAVLRGAVGLKHYRLVSLPYSEGVWSAIVMGLGVTNVAVTGEGMIWGDGSAWPQPADYGDNQEGNRARGLFFSDCRNVRLEDFTLKDAACWGIVFKCCDGVKAQRVKIDSHANANNDGFDIEARNVLIEDCDVDTGDDAFCIKSNDPHFMVENVLIRNCVGRSHCACFKLGTASHGVMRDVRFEKCVAGAPRRDFPDRRRDDGGTWFGRMNSSAALSACCVDGGVVENVQFRDISISGTDMPIFIRTGRRPRRSNGVAASGVHVLRNVTFENIVGTTLGDGVSIIAGVPGFRPKGIVLRNVRLTVTGGVTDESTVAKHLPEYVDRYPYPHLFEATLPAYGLWARHVDDLTLENVEFALSSGACDCRDAIRKEDVK